MTQFYTANASQPIFKHKHDLYAISFYYIIVPWARGLYLGRALGSRKNVGIA